MFSPRGLLRRLRPSWLRRAKYLSADELFTRRHRLNATMSLLNGLAFPQLWVDALACHGVADRILWVAAPITTLLMAFFFPRYVRTAAARKHFNYQVRLFTSQDADLLPLLLDGELDKRKPPVHEDDVNIRGDAYLNDDLTFPRLISIILDT